MDVFDAGGSHDEYHDSDTYVSERFSGLTLSLADIFAELDTP